MSTSSSAIFAGLTSMPNTETDQQTRMYDVCRNRPHLRDECNAAYKFYFQLCVYVFLSASCSWHFSKAQHDHQSQFLRRTDIKVNAQQHLLVDACQCNLPHLGHQALSQHIISSFRDKLSYQKVK